MTHLKLPYEDIRMGLMRFDKKTITIDKLIALRSILPNEDEIKTLKGYRGDVTRLGNVEQFLLKLISISKLENRIEFFAFLLGWEDHVADLNEVCWKDVFRG